MKRGGSSNIPRKRKQPGLAPGTLVHIGRKAVEKTTILVTSYDQDHIIEGETVDAGQAAQMVRRDKVNWVNVVGLHETKIIEGFKESFGLHPLLLEDVVNTEQRPKIEEYENATFIVIKALHYSQGKIFAEHISLIMMKDMVISFQEKPGDIFGPVRDRIDKGMKIRKNGADYLCYAILDSIVDHYYDVFEQASDDITELEFESLNNPTRETMQQILARKKDMVLLGKAVWPMREVLSSLMRGENPFVKKETMIYLRDVYDHSVQSIESVQTLKDSISGMMDLYMSSVSNKMNDIMRVLTIIATIFIPLTFITGIYGMNFEHMPEIPWKYGYIFALILMLAVGTGMLWFFKKKNWL